MGHTYNTGEFIKTEENLCAPFPAVFIMPKAFVQNHFLLSCFCQPVAPYVCGAQREQEEPLLNRTRLLKLHQTSASSEMCREAGLVQLKAKSSVSLLPLPAEQTNIQSKARNKFKFSFPCYIIRALLFIKTLKFSF